MLKRTKLFVTKAQSVDEKNKTVKFKISDQQVDRMGEIVDQKTWDFKNYELNPIVLWGHNPDEPENVLGTTLSLDTEGDETFATVKFDDDINPKAGMIFQQVARGTLRTVSVGFIPHDEATENDVTVLKNNELLEISVVPIPANPRAIALAYKELGMSTKDAKFMIDSMQAEAELLQKELTNDTKDVAMDELKQLLETLNANLTKMGETLTRVDANLQKLVDEEAGEDGGEGDGSGDGAGDGSGDGTDPNKAGKPSKTKSNNKDGAGDGDGDQDPANGGDDDQSGAGDGDEDEPTDETELSPEEQKAYDEAFKETVTAETATK